MEMLEFILPVCIFRYSVLKDFIGLILYLVVL